MTGVYEKKKFQCPVCDSRDRTEALVKGHVIKILKQKRSIDQTWSDIMMSIFSHSTVFVCNKILV